MTEVLSVTAAEVQPFDGITEGTVVMDVRYHEVEQRDPVTGAVTRRPLVTVFSCLAQLEVVAVVDGQHVHDLRRGTVDEQTYEPGQIVRVARPAIIAKCPCGFP